MKKIVSKKLMMTVLLASALCATATTDTPKKKAAVAQKEKAEVEMLAAPEGVRFDAANHRDPFLNPLLLIKRRQESLDEEVSRGQPPPGIAGMTISEVKFMGVSIRNGMKTAVFQGVDRRAYFLQEDDKLFDGYIKKISADSIQFVKETKFKSGKLITQDITKRLRKP